MKPIFYYGPDGEPVVTEVINSNYVARFFFDFFLNLLLVILVINMVAGKLC